MVGFILGLAAETAGAHIQTIVVVTNTARKSPNLRRASIAPCRCFTSTMIRGD